MSNVNQNSVNDPQSFDHRFATTNGIRLHYVDEGQGPPVLLLHGFLYIWFTWRHQIRALAAAGYRVVAPDLRGFGQSECPADVQRYEIFQIVGDLVGLIRTLEETSAVVIGHDLGARIAYAAAQLRPDLFRALVIFNTPIGPREALRPSELWKQIETTTGKRFYHHYFQEPGAADAVMNADIRRTLRSLLYSLSGSAASHERWRPFLGAGETVLDTVVDPRRLPEWLPAGVLDYYVTEYERHGFTPPLNHYRCKNRDWEQSACLDGLGVSQPSLYIDGAAGPSLEHFASAVDQLKNQLPNLRKTVVLEGVGHDAPEEDPKTVNRMLLEFLPTVRALLGDRE
jgi:pimeloyl-ACP methyl ester carboxylesterase